MKKYYIDEFDKLEKKHWWHITKRELVVELIKRNLYFSEKKPEILEIGAGTANISGEFLDKAQVTALDKSKTALSFCRKKGIRKLIHADFEKYCFFQKKYDIIIAADILEHLRDDKKALRKVSRLLKKNGLFILHVPAKIKLTSYWDKSLGHFRRYEMETIKSLAVKNGFFLTFSSYRISFLYPFIKIFRRLNKFSSKSQSSDFTRFSFLNSPFLWITRIENFLLLSGIAKFPFGTSIIAVMKK